LIADLVNANRSCRRFYENHLVDGETLEELVDLATINRKSLRKILDIEAHLKVLLVLAMGKPKEEMMIEAVGPDGSIRYWRDSKGVHHVPKRPLQEIIVACHAV
jgi:hypothetical protein